MQIKKIVLAVDPFTDEPELNTERVARSVIPFTKSGDCEIEAVYVMTPAGVGIPLKRFPEYQSHYKSIATDVLTAAMPAFESNVRASTIVLPQGSNSVRSGVTTLLKYVNEVKADLIALTTHARKGIDRFFLGSFAESLILKSEVPLLITNPTSACDPAYQHILFATDFAEGSNETFEKVISLAHQLYAHVTLFHRLEPENVIMPPAGFIAVEEWRSKKIEKQAQALKLKEQAEQLGVRIEVDIDLENHRVASAILKAINKHKPTLLAIAARKSSDLLATGSVPRQIIRAAQCPVLILPI